MCEAAEISAREMDVVNRLRELSNHKLSLTFTNTAKVSVFLQSLTCIDGHV